MAEVSSPVVDEGLAVGSLVEVCTRFDRSWARGFEIVEVFPDGLGPRYRLRRLSDGAVLGSLFEATEVREPALRWGSLRGVEGWASRSARLSRTR
jgi:hypothetical protein